jgi:hypothetical protein
MVQLADGDIKTRDSGGLPLHETMAGRMSSTPLRRGSARHRLVFGWEIWKYCSLRDK